MINRRDFLQKTLVGAAAVAVPASLTQKAFGQLQPTQTGTFGLLTGSSATASGMPMPTPATAYNIGYQLWGIRQLLKDNPEGTMKLVSGCGVEGVEYSGMTDTPAITFRLLQNKYGMVCCGIHYGLSEYEATGVIPKMEYCYVLGTEDIACHWLDTKHRGALEKYLDHAKVFNEIAREYKKNGFNFYYHNHQFEFQEVYNGKYAMDYMLENTDPALVSMEFHFTGQPADLDIVKYINKLGGRLAKLHFPVIDNDGNVTLKKEIIEAAKATGSCKWYIIEQNYPDQATCEKMLSRSVDVLRDMLNA
jgi:sugar phosphate isomerase/epimerase